MAITKIKNKNDAKTFLESLETGKMYTSIHTHAYDLFDSMNEANAFCNKLKELDAVGFVLTQHGVMSGVDIMKKAAKNKGLKFVPGIEAYYTNEHILRNAHLILIPKDDTGYHALCMAVSDTQDNSGKSVMTDEILNKYFGPESIGHKHIYATSACIQGVCGIELRHNDFVQHDIEKIVKKAKNVIKPEDKKLLENNKMLQSLEEELKIKTTERNNQKKIANTNFTSREKTIAKLKAKNDASVAKREAELEKDKELARQAMDSFNVLKEDCERLKTRIQAIKAETKKLNEQLNNYNALQSKTNLLEEKILSEEELKENAKKTALKFEKIFGKYHFFIELQNHGIKEEAKVYPVLAKIADEEGIPFVCSNDIHTIDNSKEELLKRKIMRSMRFGTGFEAENIGDDQLYPKSDKELSEWLLQILDDVTVAKAFANTRILFDSCNVEFKTEPHYPVFDATSTKTAEEIFDEEVKKGISWRFPNGFPDQRYESRIEYEKGIIKKMGYANYHLVVKDFLELARALETVPAAELKNAPITVEKALTIIRQNSHPYEKYKSDIQKHIIDIVKTWVKLNGWKAGISIGPGRGSAVGSEVCYVLGITSIDPLQNNLLFERFLNPERISMPDIDSDISNRVRPYVIEYVKGKYGQEAVCGIVTMNAQAPKGCIRIAAKYYDFSIGGNGKTYLSLADMIAKKVPEEPNMKFSTMVEEEKNLYDSLIDFCKDSQGIEEKDVALEILEWAKTIEGIFTAYGAHAAGIVISDGHPIKNYIPLRWNAKLSMYTTQYDMVAVEENGLLKMDFLGLQTLDIETDCLKEIAKNTGKIIDVYHLPLNDERVYKEIFQTGRTNSVFQFESAGMKNMLKRFKPTTFEDLIILVSMFRPGPMQYLDDVIEVKNGRKEITYLTPQLKPVLSKTYGAIVYQGMTCSQLKRLS